MCGFLGEYCFGHSNLTDAVAFKKLLAFSIKRGPDTQCIYRNSNFQLGFNRLAILDTSSKGNQPKTSPSGRYHIVFNGEIYNFKDLAERYSLQNLQSTSDTEVLVHLLDVLGIEQTILSLNGMFAIAIVDKKCNCFYLTRDFAGIKPLYYGVTHKGIVAASQFNQVFKHPWFHENLKLRSEIVKEYFGLGYMQAPNTIYKSIFQVNPGELLCANSSGSVTKKELIGFNRKLNKLELELKTDLTDVLTHAVSRQLVSDVSIATFLSGGIDSPLISAYAKKEKSNIEAFTLKVNNSQLNESDIAKDYAKHLDIKQEIVNVSEKDILSEIDDHFEAFSEPFGDYSSIPTYVICKAARKRHTVMLSGDGADELFFGYPRMLDVLNKRWWFILPFVIRKPLAQIFNALGLTKSWAPYFKSMNAFVLNKHLKLSKDVLNKAFPNTNFSKDLETLYKFKNNGNQSLLHQLRWNEFYAHLQRVLIKVDRASMTNSMEVRVPFLDKNCIDHAWNLKGALKHKRDLKKELKDLLSNEVPETIINKKKMGFTVPLEHWLRHELYQELQEVIFETPFYGSETMDVSVLHTYVRDFFLEKHNNAWGVWHIYAWQKWWLIHGA